ncbi:MAG: trigger factor [Deltaproteobacteria bacterium]|nr:trigger factor [Deltaproteobacteria bacterium]MBM4348382.1 trigger factor [Deltaproteobacteria bacterium]
MNITVEEISSVKKKVNVEIPQEQVTKEIESFYREVGKQAKIKGFRPGKIPKDILERHFKDYVKSEVIQKLIQETYPAALSEKDLHPVSPPVVDPGELESGKPFQYSATVEVKPEIKMEGYTGLNIEGKKESAKEEEVEERLKGLQNLHAQLKTVPEPRPVQSGDHVIIDYEARMDKKPLEEGKAVDFTVEIGGGRFIPALEEKMIGLKQEEEKEIEVPFPEDYGYKKWAGKTVSFFVKVKEIKEKVLPPLDDEFAKDLGDYASLEDLKAKLKEEIEKEKELMLDRQLKDQMIEQLIQANSFEIPESMVVEQAKALVSDTKLRLASQGIALKNLNIPEEKLQEDYKEVAQKQVRTFLILEKIAAQEGIAVTDEEADERLQSISERSHQKFDVVKRYYEKNGLIPELKTGILTDKTLNFLLEKANIS